jgi:hypothetical protein
MKKFAGLYFLASRAEGAEIQVCFIKGSDELISNKVRGGCMMKYALLAIAAGLFMMQCAGTVLKVMPEYKTMSVDKSKLGIALIRDNIAIDNGDDVNDDLGAGDYITVFADFFSAELMQQARKDGAFGEISVLDECKQSKFGEVQQSLTPQETVILLKPSHEFFQPENFPFVLVIDNVKVSRKQTSGMTMMGANGTSSTTGGSDKLVVTGTFSLWDNTAGKVVAFGKLNEKAGVFIAMTKNTWLSMVKSVSKDIFIGKPYGKSY